MAVTRAWWPSQHYSGGGLSPRVIAFHTTEGSQTAESLRNWLTNPSSKVSYHFAADMSHGDNWVANYVRTSDRAWAQANFNGAAVSIAFCTPQGGANWSRDTWLSKGAMLTAAGRLAGELARQFNIPRTQLSSSQAQGSGRGFCEHKNFGAGAATITTVATASRWTASWPSLAAQLHRQAAARRHRPPGRRRGCRWTTSASGTTPPWATCAPGSSR